MSSEVCDEGIMPMLQFMPSLGSSQFRFEDGELVLSDNEGQNEQKPSAEERNGSRKSKRKQTFERRNIKYVELIERYLFRKVREATLNEDAKAAQQAEMERRKRMLAKDGMDQTKFSNIEFLLNGKLLHVVLRVVLLCPHVVWLLFKVQKYRQDW